MKQEELRHRLIEGTIRVIAQDGLDKATTKRIARITNTNEGYIYRCFSDKEDMLAKTFQFLDEELVNEMMQHIDALDMRGISIEMRCRMFFTIVWNFLLKNRDKCLAFVRYCYSPYFLKNSLDGHVRRYTLLVEKFKAAFREEANVWMILSHMLNVILDFAVKVHTNQMPNEDDYAEHVFRVIYVSVKQYFKNYNEESRA